MKVNKIPKRTLACPWVAGSLLKNVNIASMHARRTLPRPVALAYWFNGGRFLLAARRNGLALLLNNTSVGGQTMVRK